MQHVITLYTDGAYSSATKTGGYAFFLKSKNAEKLVHGQVKDGATAPRMELLAVVLGLEAIRRPAHVTVVSDATYVIQPIAGDYIAAMSQTPERPNRDLWERLKGQNEFHASLHAQYVKAHSGHRLNDLVDKEAKREAGTYKEKRVRSCKKQSTTTSEGASS